MTGLNQSFFVTFLRTIGLLSLLNVWMYEFKCTNTDSDVWLCAKIGSRMWFMRSSWLYLWLTELHQLQNITFEPIVFGSGVSKDIDEGSGQRNLQSFLYGSYAHLWTVAPTLSDRIIY